jgi:hypothetical protein
MLFIPFSKVEPIKSFKEAVLIFIGTDSPDWQEISSKYDAWAKGNVAPPNILLLTHLDHAKKLISEASEEDEGRDRFELLRRQSDAYIGGFDHDGNISVAKAGERDFLDGDWQEVLRSAVDAYIEAESRNESLVVAAPLGFYFSKLSNRYSSHFIRTESLLRCAFSIELLALRLLPAFSSYCEQQKRSASKVRVLLDSMVIWPVAQALTQMHQAEEEIRYAIESFKSYEGVGSHTVPSGPAFVIISASTSGGLETKLLNVLGAKQVEVWTLLGLKPELESEVDDDEDGSLKRNEIFALPRTLEGAPALGGLREVFQPDVAAIPPGAEAVRVIGERFLSHNVRPKLVRLAHKSLDDRHKTTLANLAKEKIVLAARRRLGGKAWWSISFDLRALVNKYSETGETPSVLEHWLTNYAFPGPVLVVYPHDVESANVPDIGQNERLAQRAKRILLKTAKDPSDVRVVDHTALDRPESEVKEFLSRAGVLVIAPVIANGFIFKQISASLRSVKLRGPRLYISLAVLPDSQVRLSELKADLESNSDDSAYRFKHGLALPIGRIDETIGWQHEYTLLKEVKETCEDLGIAVPQRFSMRVASFADAKCLDGEHTFLPTCAGDPLPITGGFLLWSTKEPISGNEYGSAVLFTVAAFLEACRAARSGANDTSLISGLFQQTLIAPANFTRFNDPAIQAALLRCAYPSEMNYAASAEASQDMSQLIKKFIRLHDAPSGAALGEFLLALALERLTLERSHLTDVLNATKDLPGWVGVLATKIPRP